MNRKLLQSLAKFKKNIAKCVQSNVICLQILAKFVNWSQKPNFQVTGIFFKKGNRGKKGDEGQSLRCAQGILAKGRQSDREGNRWARHLTHVGMLTTSYCPTTTCKPPRQHPRRCAADMKVCRQQGVSEGGKKKEDSDSTECGREGEEEVHLQTHVNPSKTVLSSLFFFFSLYEKMGLNLSSTSSIPSNC